MRTKLRVQIASRMAMKQTGGFTLIELMMVLVIGGILAAISMPYFFSRANAAKQTEGKMLVGVLNRSQQAYYTEHARFAASTDAMAIRLSSRNYDFGSRVEDETKPYVMNFATSKVTTVRSYVGMAAIVQDVAGNQAMQTILCEAQNPGTTEAPKPTYNVSTIECGAETQALSSK